MSTNIKVFVQTTLGDIPPDIKIFVQSTIWPLYYFWMNSFFLSEYKLSIQLNIKIFKRYYHLKNKNIKEHLNTNKKQYFCNIHVEFD